MGTRGREREGRGLVCSDKGKLTLRDLEAFGLHPSLTSGKTPTKIYGFPHNCVLCHVLYFIRLHREIEETDMNKIISNLSSLHFQHVQLVGQVIRLRFFFHFAGRRSAKKKVWKNPAHSQQLPSRATND